MEFLRSIFGKKEKEAPPEAEAKRREEERRKFERTPTDIGTFIVLPNGKQINARILDISQGGVKLAVQMTLEIGIRYELLLHKAESKTKIMIMIKWERVEGEDYIYGAEFFLIDPSQRTTIMQFIKSAER